jgi:hypothetical protein
VLAALALFVSLSGTAVAATVIITSNSQVAPHVIAGAAAPAGTKKNLIAGSVGAADLHAGAVTRGKLGPDVVDTTKVEDNTLTGADIHDFSVGGSDIVPSEVAFALKLVHNIRSAIAGGSPEIYTAGPFTVTGECVDDGGGSVHARVVLSSQLDTIIAVNADTGAEIPSMGSQQVAQTPSSATTTARGGDFTAQSTFSEQYITGRVMAWTFGGSCAFRFDGTSGPVI